MKQHQTVCFTGHRYIPAQDREDLRLALRAELKRRVAEGCVCFRAGGALGFDTMAALEVLALRKCHPQIRLDLVLPCPSQADGWRADDVKLYQQILEQADSYTYINSYYFNGILQLRNQRLVEGADVCIAYLRTSHGGGTAYTGALAIRSGLEFVNLADLVGWIE